MTTTKEQVCISISKKAKLAYLRQQLADLALIPKEFNFRFITLPLVLILMLIRMIGHITVTTIKIWSVFVELPLSPKDRTLHSLWVLHGLDESYSDEIRFDVLEQWIEVLYSEQHIDIEAMVQATKIKENGAKANNIIDFVVRDMVLPDY